MSADDQKRSAAQKALDYVEDGMRLGLGTGSTAALFVDAVGKRVAEGLNVLCVPTSEATAAQARGLDIPLTTLDETPELDLTVDGADELDGDLVLIKGGGGALLREKIVATSSSRMVVIADASKRVDVLGAFPLPVEVVPFGAEATARSMAGCDRPRLRGRHHTAPEGRRTLHHRWRPLSFTTAPSAGSRMRLDWARHSTGSPAWSSTACSCRSPRSRLVGTDDGVDVLTAPAG